MEFQHIVKLRIKWCKVDYTVDIFLLSSFVVALRKIAQLAEPIQRGRTSGSEVYKKGNGETKEVNVNNQLQLCCDNS